MTFTQQKRDNLTRSLAKSMWMVLFVQDTEVEMNRNLNIPEQIVLQLTVGNAVCGC